VDTILDGGAVVNVDICVDRLEDEGGDVGLELITAVQTLVTDNVGVGLPSGPATTRVRVCSNIVLPDAQVVGPAVEVGWVGVGVAEHTLVSTVVVMALTTTVKVSGTMVLPLAQTVFVVTQASVAKYVVVPSTTIVIS
jgi:hypothetical protein